ncbi:MAG: hypothetical protein U5K69_15075 [Balneolaceae bacterium]|nr:hypothetical protein [Balneolaceae bacterium]
MIAGVPSDSQAQSEKVQIVNLSNGEDKENFNSIREVFKERNRDMI